MKEKKMYLMAQRRVWRRLGPFSSSPPNQAAVQLLELALVMAHGDVAWKRGLVGSKTGSEGSETGWGERPGNTLKNQKKRPYSCWSWRW